MGDDTQLATKERGTRRTAPRELRLTLPATPEQLRPMRAALDRWATSVGLAEATVADLQLAVGEAVANAVEHAYRGGPPGTVDVSLAVGPLSGGGVAVRVADAGSWRRPLPDAGHRGRGLAMIRALGRNVDVRRGPLGTVVTFEVGATDRVGP